MACHRQGLRGVCQSSTLPDTDPAAPGFGRLVARYRGPLFVRHTIEPARLVFQGGNRFDGHVGIQYPAHIHGRGCPSVGARGAEAGSAPGRYRVRVRRRARQALAAPALMPADGAAAPNRQAGSRSRSGVRDTSSGRSSNPKQCSEKGWSPLARATSAQALRGLSADPERRRRRARARCWCPWPCQSRWWPRKVPVGGQRMYPMVAIKSPHVLT